MQQVEVPCRIRGSAALIMYYQTLGEPRHAEPNYDSTACHFIIIIIIIMRNTSERSNQRASEVPPVLWRTWSEKP